MRLPRVRFKLRQMMAAVATVALITFAATWDRKPPAAVLRSAQKQVPGIKIQRIRPEVFNDRDAWEVKGIDQQGLIWLIDVSPSGEVLMIEPIYDTVNKIPLGAVGPIEDPHGGSREVVVARLETSGSFELLMRVSSRDLAR